MSKQQYESTVKMVPSAQNVVYSKLSDLNNLAVVKQRLQDPQYQTLLAEKVPADKMEQLLNAVQNMTFDTDSVSCNVAPLGDVSLRIVNREEPKTIKFEAVNSPIPLNLWIQLLPVSEYQSKMKITIQAELNMFIKAMVNKPLKEGVEKLADMLAMIPYGA